MPAGGDKLVKAVGLVGAIANWTIPLAAIANFNNDPALINPGMTGVLFFYSAMFMRWSIAISPANYPLFACHVTNMGAQASQVLRYM
eukprot:Ihof_evm3s197 gene=Ihof_evmTU3s197